MMVEDGVVIRYVQNRRERERERERGLRNEMKSQWVNASFTGGRRTPQSKICSLSSFSFVFLTRFLPFTINHFPFHRNLSLINAGCKKPLWQLRIKNLNM